MLSFSKFDFNGLDLLMHKPIVTCYPHLHFLLFCIEVNDLCIALTPLTMLPSIAEFGCLDTIFVTHKLEL